METNAQYFDGLCRTCMNKVEASSHGDTTKPQLQWLSISDIIEECGALRIAELLSDAVPQIVVQPSDELPNKICPECLQQLLSVYWFQKMCVQSDKEMHELISKEQLVLEEEIKGEPETNDAHSEPSKDLTCSSALKNLPQPSIQKPNSEVTVPTIEPEAAQSSADDHLQDKTKLLEHCNDSQCEFEEFIKNEPIEDDAVNSEYSDGDTIHSTISVIKDELVEPEDQQLNDSSPPNNTNLSNKSYKRRECLRRQLSNHVEKANSFLTRHLNFAHSKEPQRYTYGACNKSLASSSGLRQHIPKHTGERSYVSPECGKSFTTQSTPAEQRTLHAEDKPYGCPYCPLRFNSKSGAWSHKKIHEGIKPHKCSVCGKKFVLKSHLTRHKRIHSKEKQHKCDQCEKKFPEMQKLKIHIRRHTGENPYKCKYCECRFISSSLLIQHIRCHLGKNIHRCKFCPLAFPSNAEMRLHLTSHKNEDPEVRERNLKALQEEEAKLKLKFSKEKSKGQPTEDQQQQKLCSKEIAQRSTDILAEQRTTHTEDKPFECPYCPLRFNSKSGVSIHKAIHKEAKRHECSICGKMFKIKSSLIQHKRIHSEKIQHKCDLCEKRFTHMQSLKNHIRTHTGEKPYKCKYCERGYVSSSLLNYHLRRHLGKNIHRCKFCPLVFPLAAEVRLHLTSHKNEDPEVRERNLKALKEEEAKLVLKFSKEKSKGESAEERQQQKIKQPSTDTYARDKPYECPYCPLRFRSKALVSNHKVVHEEAAKRRECDICGQKFRQKADLTIHKRIHSNEKPHKCDFCEKRFVRSQHLKIHIRTHTGEKPYKCKYCERDFASLSQLTSHLHTHLGKNIYRCQFCPLAVPSYAELRVHLTSHKNEDPETRDRNLKALQEDEAKLVLNSRQKNGKNRRQKRSSNRSCLTRKSSNRQLASRPKTRTEVRDEDISIEISSYFWEMLFRVWVNTNSRCFLKNKLGTYEAENRVNLKMKANDKIKGEASLKNLLKKSEPIEDYKSNKEFSDEDTMHSTISVTKGEALPIESEDQQVNETRDEFEEFIIIIE